MTITNEWNWIDCFGQTPENGKHMVKVKGLKVLIFIYCHLQGDLNSSGLQFEVVYWPALAVGGVARTHTELVLM